MASFSILIGTGTIVQESLVISIKKKCTFDFFPETEFLSGLGCLELKPKRSTCFCLPNAAITTQQKKKKTKKHALLILQVKTLEPGGRDACL